MSKALFVQKKIRNTHKIRRKNEISIKNLQDTRGQDYRQGAQTFFERKKWWLRYFLGEKKGGEEARTFFEGKRGANSFF